MNLDISPLREFAQGLAGQATPVEWAWQLGVALVMAGLGWWAAHVTCREIKPSPRWKFGEGDFEHVAVPLFAYGFVLVGKAILARFQASVVVLDILQSLLVAAFAIRVAAYILGHILPRGSFLRGSVRTIGWIAWIAVALHITGLLPEVIGALDDVGFTLGKDQQRVTLLLVLQALAALVLTLTIGAWISRVTETRILAAKDVEMSTKVVVTKLLRVSMLFLAVLVALPMVGIDITALAIFGSALGVGLGFGLQKIASNYVSGFIVLLDRSLRIGDLITVDGRRGVVTGIESRYTVVKSPDGTESIIPNEKLITDSVSHHTFSDPKVAVHVGLQVAYDSDLDAALKLLAECARGQPQVIADPAPLARAKAFRDDGIEVELVCWIADVLVGDADLKSALIRDIVKRFAAAGIEIPYPRRDVRLLATTATGKNVAKTID